MDWAWLNETWLTNVILLVITLILLAVVLLLARISRDLWDLGFRRLGDLHATLLELKRSGSRMD